MPAKKSNFKKKILIYLAIALGLAGLLFYFKNQFIVAWVNGRPISRIAYTQELQKLAKTQAMDSLLTKRLIITEAAKNKVTVAKEEIDEAMNNIDERAKAQGASLEELLQAQGVSRESLREEIRLQKLLEKLVGNITIDDEKVSGYFKDNQTALYEGKTLNEVKDEIKEQLTQQELINKIQELIARLQSEAKIVNWL